MTDIGQSALNGIDLKAIPFHESHPQFEPFNEAASNANDAVRAKIEAAQ
jgi:hypothetical protein